MRNTLKFVAKVIIISLVFLVVVTVPQILVEVWGYLKSDIGYMWTINMAIAIIVSISVFAVLKHQRVRGWLIWTLAILTMLIVVVVCECLIWHPNEIGSLIAAKASLEKVKYTSLGIGFATGVYWFENRRDPYDPEETDQEEEQ